MRWVHVLVLVERRSNGDASGRSYIVLYRCYTFLVLPRKRRAGYWCRQALFCQDYMWSNANYRNGFGSLLPGLRNNNAVDLCRKSYASSDITYEVYRLNIEPRN